MAGDLATLIGGRVIVSDPSVEAAVVELARKGIINFGVPFADCDVAALLNVEDDHVGVDGVATVEELAAVKALVLARADKAAVLNADHPLVMAQRPVCRAGRIILVSESPSSPEAARHIAEGGTAVSLETRKGKEFVSVFAGRAKPRPLVEAAAIPATRSGRLRFNVTNAMFAAALALGLEIPEEAIGSALRGFEATLDSDPGRFNVFDGLPFTAVLDFAHNPHGIAAVCDGVDAIAAKGRKIVVMCNLGNRHLRHIEPGAARLARSFDIFLCSRNKRRCAQNPELAGKPADEVPRLIGEALRRHGVGGDRIETFTEERDAVDRAFAIARPGDFLLIAAHEFDYLGAKVEELRRALADAGR